MTMEKQPFEDVSPILKMVIFHCHVCFLVGILFIQVSSMSLVRPVSPKRLPGQLTHACWSACARQLLQRRFWPSLQVKACRRSREKWSKHAETPMLSELWTKKIYRKKQHREKKEKKTWPETGACCSDFGIKDVADVINNIL